MSGRGDHTSLRCTQSAAKCIVELRRSHARFRARHPPPPDPDSDGAHRLFFPASTSVRPRLSPWLALTHHRVGTSRHGRAARCTRASGLGPRLGGVPPGAARFWCNTWRGSRSKRRAAARGRRCRAVASPTLPRPTLSSISQAREGLVANVYTEPDWRRHGVATLLMRHRLTTVQKHSHPASAASRAVGRWMLAPLVARICLIERDEARPSVLTQKKRTYSRRHPRRTRAIMEKLFYQKRGAPARVGALFLCQDGWTSFISFDGANPSDS